MQPTDTDVASGAQLAKDPVLHLATADANLTAIENGAAPITALPSVVRSIVTSLRHAFGVRDDDVAPAGTMPAGAVDELIANKQGDAIAALAQMAPQDDPEAKMAAARGEQLPVDPATSFAKIRELIANLRQQDPETGRGWISFAMTTRELADVVAQRLEEAIGAP